MPFDTKVPSRISVAVALTVTAFADSFAFYVEKFVLAFVSTNGASLTAVLQKKKTFLFSNSFTHLVKGQITYVKAFFANILAHHLCIFANDEVPTNSAFFPRRLKQSNAIN